MNKSTLLLCLLIYLSCFQCASVQNKNPQTTTIVLLRHAEKDTTKAGNNPPLSVEGAARAKRLTSSFPNLVPDEFYSTPYIRTIETLNPWAQATGKEIKTYQPGNSLEFADELLKQKGKTIVVAGHSNTIPALVNLLIKNEKYKLLHDSAYSNLYVITINNGNVKDKLLHY